MHLSTKNIDLDLDLERKRGGVREREGGERERERERERGGEGERKGERGGEEKKKKKKLYFNSEFYQFYNCFSEKSSKLCTYKCISIILIYSLCTNKRGDINLSYYYI